MAQGTPANAPSRAPQPPSIRARAAIVVEAQTGAVLFAKQPDKRLPPASTTKILTALLLARNVPPQQHIPVSPAAAATPGNALGMRHGETFAARDLLHAILLVSANDASVAAAEHISGTTERFVAQMNAAARQMGALNTHFVNPHGLDHPDHYSTARDLATLARHAMQNPLFAAAARMRTYRISHRDGQPPTVLTNQDTLLWTFPGAEGIKTGWTRAAGYCFVGAARRGGRRIITVVLNSPDWRAETAALLRYGFSCLERRTAGNQNRREPASPPAPSSGRLNPAAVGPAALCLPAQAEAMQASALPSPSQREGPGVRSLPSAAAPGGARRRGVARQSREPLSGVPCSPLSADPGSGPGARASAPPSPLSKGVSVLPSALQGEGPGRRGEKAERKSLGVGLLSSPSQGEGVGGRAFAAGRPYTLHPTPYILRKGPGVRAATIPGRGTPFPSEGRAGREEGRGVRSNTTAPYPEEKARSHRPFSPEGAARFHPVTPWPPPLPFAWLWWLPLLALFVLLAWWLLRRLYAGNQAMNKSTRSLAGLLGRPSRKPQADARPVAEAVPEAAETENGKAAPAAPPFTFNAPPIARRSGREWLEGILETHRLLEPAVRRQARALLDAEPHIGAEKIAALLSSANAKLRAAAASLLLSHAPRRAEETLLALLEDEQTPAEVQADAVQLLAEAGGDRHEALWVQKLLRNGSSAAAHTLASLPRLREETRQALHRALAAQPPAERDAAARQRFLQITAQIACILGAHRALEPEVAATYLERLPANQRDQVMTSVLQGSSTPWAIERLVETLLRGHAYPALQALLACDPAAVRAALDAHKGKLDAPERTRATILQWLIWGEGEERQIKQLAEAGDSLAVGALNLARTHRWDITTAPPDALLAAAQIFSLRLGFSTYSQEQVAAVFHAAATGEMSSALLAQMPEMEPLARVYARPEVYDAVQVALHAEDGLGQLLAGLAHRPENRSYQEELAFWSDKTPASIRLMLLHSLCLGETPQARAAVAARAADPCPLVRAAALRSLRVRPYAPESVQAADGPEGLRTDALSASTSEPDSPLQSLDDAA